MKTHLQKMFKSLLFVPALMLGLSFAAPVGVGAQTCDTSEVGLQSGVNCSQGDDQTGELFGTDSIFNTVVNILLFLVGAISVIMLVIGGFRYVLSGGDQNAVTSAKNTILYAIIGIIVAFLAYAAVNFVTTQLIPSP